MNINDCFKPRYRGQLCLFIYRSPSCFIPVVEVARSQCELLDTQTEKGKLAIRYN